MLREALELILGMKTPDLVEANDGNEYSAQKLHRVVTEAPVKPLKLRSLSGIVDYVKSEFDTNRELLIHVESPTTVSVYDALNDDNERRAYIQSEAVLPRIYLDQFLSRDKFNIQLQSCFVEEGTDQQRLLRLISTIVEDDSVRTEDNGISQSVTTRQGVATVSEEKVPGRVILKPFRTFVEVPQPASDFIFRLENGPKAGLFEADGGAWEIDAMENIAGYLSEELAEAVTAGRVRVIN